MASICVDRLDAGQEWLPNVYICCIQPAERLVEHRFYYQPTWLIICNLILPAIVRW